jgi:hypothetical protein
MATKAQYPSSNQSNCILCYCLAKEKQQASSAVEVTTLSLLLLLVPSPRLGRVKGVVQGRKGLWHAMGVQYKVAADVALIR